MMNSEKPLVTFTDRTGVAAASDSMYLLSIAIMT
jgi:hypothetical protein